MEKKRNLWVIPTDKPSRLHKYDFDGFALSKEALNWKEAKNIYITNSEEIKERNYALALDTNTVFKVSESDLRAVKKFPHLYKKIILTTDQDLIKDGVQAIDNNFLEWFVKNPSCERVEVNKLCYGALSGFADAGYKIIIPKEESKQDLDCPFDFTSRCTMGRCDCKPKQVTLEEVAKKYAELSYYGDEVDAFVRGVKYQQEQCKKDLDAHLDVAENLWLQVVKKKQEIV